jgi:nitroimidazol reductase NimA-like FMN-containing flavoprotein (pyridoxamine 5'-phosphate oxidase superfamily)
MMIDEGLEILTEEECRALLAEGGIGRIGLTVGALPVILPVNFTYVDGDVVFRSGGGTKLQASREGTVVAFEIDAYDAAGRSGWSVLVVGRAREVEDAAELAALRQYSLAPRADADRAHYVRLSPEMLTGRRIVAT